MLLRSLPAGKGTGGSMEGTGSQSPWNAEMSKAYGLQDPRSRLLSNLSLLIVCIVLTRL